MTPAAWLLLSAVAFAVGFWLSWRRLRRRLQARVNEVAADEVRRRIESQVLEQLRRGGRRNHRNDTGDRQ